MTDKEQIIIDGVDVSGCILRRRKEPNCTVCNGYSSKVFEFDCSDFKNCYFKQLARKTQEYEELKEEYEAVKSESFTREELITLQEKDIDSYRKALEEIKKYTREQFCDNCEDISSTEYNCHCEYCEYQEYFDIIDKAKG